MRWPTARRDRHAAAPLSSRTKLVTDAMLDDAQVDSKQIALLTRLAPTLISMASVSKIVAKLEAEGLTREHALQAAKHPRMSATSTQPSDERTGYSHRQCYARGLEDCSRDLSREHYISKGVLESVGNVIEASGFDWQKGATMSLSPEAIAARILCKRHNEALSPLDAEAKRFFRTLREIDTALGDEAPPTASETFMFNGPDIQRWLLKCLVGLVESNNPPGRLRDHHLCIRVLFGETTWPQYWGLYLDTHRNSHAFSGLSLTVLNGPDKSIWACRFNIAGVRSQIALGRAKGDGLLYRPSGIRFQHAARTGVQELTFGWTHPPFSDYATYVRSAPYSGEPIDRF
jgi:hypothetical protein